MSCPDELERCHWTTALTIGILPTASCRCTMKAEPDSILKRLADVASVVIAALLGLGLATGEEAGLAAR
jgi:hypothetical protein